MSNPDILRENVADPYAGERLKLSHFHERQAALNLRDAWSSWNGFKFADYYYDVDYEYFCIRNTCGTYDICPMQKYLIEGADALAMLDRMVTRDLNKLRINRVTYVAWCNDSGRMIDDGTIFRLGESKFLLTCGSPCLAWLRKSALGFNRLSIVEHTEALAALSLQGPTSFAVLKAMGLEATSALKPFDIGHYPFAEGEIMISRTGFTGDLGYELWIEPNLALTLWDRLYEAGANYGIQPYGEAATNMARLEAGFIMPYMEFNEALKTVNFEYDQTPLELDLAWLVDFKKPHFNGRRALLEQHKTGPKTLLTKLNIEGNKPAEEALLYSDHDCGDEIGYVTSAMWSPSVKANIALAMINVEALSGDIWTEIYYQKELRHHRKVARCTVQKKAFWGPERAKVTPPSLT
ncbi:MAG: aminomethyl transferase family protein [Halieaceae bacterium]|jgi:aminomethyltransferase|nr:aminomethyl transferase family protein [Halieaceae bacterium]MBT6332187.1 aminomethyl transferase family protein [Halieaceae bacterium]MBT7340340.1 aminomethyl transferase family protein [Halieaceae bacterium]MDG1828153.1 aminomethyltransferase family protein [Luminiphilus sp.]MDG2137686.1 aminomethyltransferase family protein [Luminiphilus sp.]